jgi:DNA repair exonuclease SbcCD ATPase subunit
MSLRREATKPAADDAPAADPAATIEQVRELLFGDANRSLDQRTIQLDAKIDRLAAEMNERFNQVERRISELQAQTEASVPNWCFHQMPSLALTGFSLLAKKLTALK